MALKITIEVSDDIAASAEAEAERMGTDVATVVERALVKDLGFRAIERIQDRFDLDEEAAMNLAYDQLRAVRKERRSA
ncbi:MAG TPA: hypothetical protein VL961_05190 [Acidimicrobiales bacterium]|nr:hypothetical protein [Acidimicrobiales bacterium]